MYGFRGGERSEAAGTCEYSRPSTAETGSIASGIGCIRHRLHPASVASGIGYIRHRLHPASVASGRPSLGGLGFSAPDARHRCGRRRCVELVEVRVLTAPTTSLLLPRCAQTNAQRHFRLWRPQRPRPPRGIWSRCTAAAVLLHSVLTVRFDATVGSLLKARFRFSSLLFPGTRRPHCRAIAVAAAPSILRALTSRSSRAVTSSLP